MVEGSIASFEQLRKEFLKAFIINNQLKNDATYLLNIQQSNKETFWRQFKNATLEIQDSHLGVTVARMFNDQS